ncbi:MAG: FtsX-like permease family protein, partial [Burkholderiaceae bacterium]|nr:FtsX-like permease family protein [Burkholderiaceae bacterium]
MVAAASPVIETEIRARRADPRTAGEDEGEAIRLKLIGLDVFRAAEVTPALLARGEQSGAASQVFADDAVFLSPAALDALGASRGEHLVVNAAGRAVRLRIAGTLGAAAPGQRLAVMDIGAAQWRLGWLGRLNRIDLRLAPGIDIDTVRGALQPLLGPAATVAAPDAAYQRMSKLSRAYRVNLSVLALVALFTGGFIVHATIALAVARQVPELALLAVLGAPRRFIASTVLGQGAVLGALGAALGIAAGFGLAALMVTLVGGDLGGGYFQQSRPELALDMREAAAFAALGIAVGLAGSAASARSSRRMPPARALRSSGLLAARPARSAIVRAAALGAIGALLLLLPPVQGLPLASYLAIAAWLFAAVAFVAVLTGALGRAARASAAVVGRRPVLWLSSCRVAGAPDSAAAALAGVVASVALASAMAIMVHSFRDSVDRWLDAVLPADLYLRARSPGADAALPAPLQARLLAIDGVARIEFQRAGELVIEASRPAVALLARPIESGRAGDTLALTGALLEAPSGTIPIYVSEAMVDLYAMRAGRSVSLPIAATTDARFFV